MKNEKMIIKNVKQIYLYITIQMDFKTIMIIYSAQIQFFHKHVCVQDHIFLREIQKTSTLKCGHLW